MKTHDVVILSLTKDSNTLKMTLNCIKSLRSSEPNVKFNVILIESNINSSHYYKDIADQVITPNTKFNYNKFMNIGMEYTTSEWVSLCNNDLLFYENWATTIHNFHEDNPEYKSFGHWNDYNNWHQKRFPKLEPFYEGYKIGYELTGWAITTKRDTFDIINLDDRVEFWFSDNIYADELQKHNIKHALIPNSRIIHYESVTARTIPIQYGYYEQQAKYKGETNEN